MLGFESRTEIANWVNVAAFVLSIYLMLSFLVLPVKFTHRHYLSVCLSLAVIFIEVRGTRGSFTAKADDIRS